MIKKKRKLEDRLSSSVSENKTMQEIQDCDIVFLLKILSTSFDKCFYEFEDNS